jgi:hypothetical protein
MKVDVQYVNDSKGNISAIQVPLTEWNKVLTRLRKYEQMLKMKSDLTEAFEQVGDRRKSKSKKQTLTEFLDEI